VSAATGRMAGTAAREECPIKITISYEDETVVVDQSGVSRTLAFADPEAFAAVSRAWLRLGWDVKYVYGFSWLGRPIIQLPEDMVRIQEAIYRLQPEVIVETGIAHGGSLIFYAGLCRTIGKGRVIGVDIEIRPHNRAAIESHELFDLIELVEGDSTAPETVARVRDSVGDTAPVLVLLDSNHSKEHVLAELEAYGALVTAGSYVVAADGIMEQVVGGARTQPDWAWNNPRAAAEDFLAEHPEFILDVPEPPFNEGDVREPVTYWPGGWLRRLPGG
jgi:cephalosporin hydroxylase